MPVQCEIRQSICNQSHRKKRRISRQQLNEKFIIVTNDASHRAMNAFVMPKKIGSPLWKPELQFSLPNMMKAYRAHKSTLQPGDVVPPSTSFFDAMLEDKKTVERFLESARPSQLPKREDAIFVFEDEIQGRKWASRELKNLYLVELKTNCILHRADWCWLSVITDALMKNDPQTAIYADNYWAGKATECPVWELLVASATVVEEIIIPGLERNRLRFEAHGFPNLRD
jgi:hypothetical protein